MGVIKSPISGKWRHLDIRIVNYTSLPYTWMYFTGGKIFNKLIRERLKKKGYKLNEWGLYKYINDKNVKNIIEVNLEIDKTGKTIEYGHTSNDGRIIISDNEMMEYIIKIERQLFELADLEYKNIKERY